MLNDKEAIIKIVNELGVEVMQKGLGMSPVFAKFASKTAINNLLENYEFMINMFFNKEGNIDTDEFFAALKDELTNRPNLKIGKVKINPEIVDELMGRFAALRANNG